jgi:hypothetical protein
MWFTLMRDGLEMLTAAMITHHIPEDNVVFCTTSLLQHNLTMHTNVSNLTRHLKYIYYLSCVVFESFFFFLFLLSSVLDDKYFFK